MAGYVPAIDTYGMLNDIGNNFIDAQQRNAPFPNPDGSIPVQPPGFFARILSGQNPFGSPAPQSQSAAAPAVTAGAGAPTLASPMKPFQDAIGSIESDGSGGYSAVGPVSASGDRGYGRYQVMGANIPQWTQEILGRPLTPQQFLLSPRAQDTVFNAKFGSYLQSSGNPQDAASLWFTGRPLAQGAGLRDVNGMTGSSYAAKFQRALDLASGGGPSAGPTPGASVQLAGPVPTPNTSAAAGQGAAITVPGYEGQFTRAQANDAEGTPSQAEWDAEAAKQPGGRLNMMPTSGATGPSGVPSVGSGATATPMGQLMPQYSPQAINMMLNNPYQRWRGQALFQQQLQQGHLQIKDVPVNGSDGTFAGTQPWLVSADGRTAFPMPGAAIDTSKVKESAQIVHLSDGTFQSVDKSTGKPIGAPIGQPTSMEPTLTPQAIEELASRSIQGDNSALSSLGYGKIGAANRTAVANRVATMAQEKGIDATGIVRNIVGLSGEKAGAGTMGRLGARISTFAEEGKQTADEALNASADLPREAWLPIEKIIQAGESMTNNPRYIRLLAANNGLANTYSKAINPSGVLTDEGRRAAFEILNVARSKEAYAAGINQLHREMNIVQNAIGASRASQLYGGQATPSAPPGTPQVAPAQGAPVVVPSTQGTPRLGSVPIPMGAANALKAQPARRQEFDAKYGAGASDQVLGPARQSAPVQFQLPPNGQPLPAGVM